MYIVKSTFKGYLDIGIGTLGPGASAPLDELNDVILAYQSAGRVTVTFKEGGVYTAPPARSLLLRRRSQIRRRPPSLRTP
jgi:hypothetical protein